MLMKLKDGFVLRKIGDENIVIPIGEKADEIHGIIQLSESGAFLWELLESEQTEESLLEAIQEEFEIDSQTAANDITKFIKHLKSQGWLI